MTHNLITLNVFNDRLINKGMGGGTCTTIVNFLLILLQQ